MSSVFDVAESNQNENYQASFVLYTNDLFILWKYRAGAFKMRNNVTKLKILVQIYYPRRMLQIDIKNQGELFFSSYYLILTF